MVKIHFILCALLPQALPSPGEQQSFKLDWYQNEYNLIPERAEVISYDKRFFKQFHISTFKYNRTCTAFNITTLPKMDINNEYEVMVQAYKFASNEYRLFPLRFQFNFCKSLAQNFAGTAKLPCGNMTDGCPFVKDKMHHLCNWTPDHTKLPPFIPTGRYMAELHFIHYSSELAIAHAYAAVTRPEV